MRDKAIIATLSVTGLNAATKYDGATKATFARAATIAKMLNRKKERLRHVRIAQAAMVIYSRPTIGSNAAFMCDAAIIARSSAWLKSSFGTRPCHSQISATATREVA